jgi:tripartite-type tricarboxylate transporter receptor subunit TctC
LIRSHSLKLLAAVLLAGALAASAAAADFPIPGKPIRVLVGFPPGGGTDLQARALAQQMQEAVGVPVLVENRPGASTMIAANEVARAAADGHTLLYTPSSTLAQLPHTLSAVKYDPFKDFTPVSLAALGPLVLVVHKSVPVNSVRELVAYAKAHPGELNYVSQGVGTSAHIYGDAFARQTGIVITHVPYKGANDVAKDFVTGRVHLQFASSSAAVALAKTGEVRMLAVVAPRRSSLFPDLPTMGEQGVSGVDIESWIGFFGPAGLAPQTVARINEVLGQALKQPRLREDFRAGGVEAQGSTPEQFATIVRDSYNQWGRMLAQIGFRKE